jgi:hypothetical protein
VPDSDPREFGLNSKKRAFSLAPFFWNWSEMITKINKKERYLKHSDEIPWSTRNPGMNAV